MKDYFGKQAHTLYEEAKQMINTVSMLKANRNRESSAVDIPEDFKNRFFNLVDQVNLSLMEDRDNFYGYFLFQMSREIRFDVSSPSAVSFKGANYVIYFNPIIFLALNIKQMESTIKHEIHHIIGMHLVRAKALKGRYSQLAMNMAMDLVVNSYLTDLPPYATTLNKVNSKYALKLEPYESFEYYVEKLQIALDLLEEDEESEDQSEDNNEVEYSPEKTHDTWDESDAIDEKTIGAFTEKIIESAPKSNLSTHLEELIATFKKCKGELPWNVYLSRLMGTVESNPKKTITRRNRRQPDRLDLRGNLRSHKAEIAVALDISGSISDEEFKQGIKEVLSIVKNYNHEITLIECDNQIRRVYKIKSVKDIKDRMSVSGGTKFTPVFEYANKTKINLLVYFTDGKGESKLSVIPRGYKVLWVISGNGDQLSLKEPYGIIKKLSKIEMKNSGFDVRDVRNDGYSMNHQEPIF